MEKNKVPVAGEFYRHFKGNLYQVIGVAKHSETEETMVVYQALYGDYGWYVRPLSEFVSPVDKNKYPDAVQESRFERVVLGGEKEVSMVRETVEESKSSVRPEVQVSFVSEDAQDEKNDEEFIRTEILQFLDAEGAGEKLKVLREIRQSLDENLVTTMELSMDILPDDKETLERRIDLIERTLEQKVRYEGGRLR